MKKCGESKLIAAPLHISKSGEKVALRVFATWIHRVDTCACMPLCGHVSLFVCRIGSIPPTWRATRADGVPKVQRLPDGDGSRREVRGEGLAGLEGRASAWVIHAVRCLSWTCGVRGREVSRGAFALLSNTFSPDLAAFFALLSESPVNFGRLAKRQTGN